MITILLVEDHTIFTQALLRLLQEKGQHNVVAVARSAEEALETLQDQAVDLVLIDVALPKISGISLVLGLHQEYPELPRVMLSGHLSVHYARRSLEVGARGYLVKDYVDEILRGIQSVLDGEIYVSEALREA